MDGQWGLIGAIVGAQGWPATEGEVVKSEVYRDRGVYYPRVEYRYLVEGSELTGSVVSFGGVFGTNFSKTPARSVVDHYPSGRQVLVYYDPRRPSRSCLERTAGLRWLMFAGVGVAMLATGLRLLWRLAI
jgi:hypothetical protein